MTDYAEEQRNELEAIESIYPESFTAVLSDDPTSFTITVTSDPGDSGETVEATIKFTYVEKYPDEPPLWEIHSQENLEERDAQDILTLLQQQVEENLGMVMIFTLVTAVQEKLNEIVDVMKNEEKTEGGEAGRQGQADGSRAVLRTLSPSNSITGGPPEASADLLKLSPLSGKQLFERDRNLDTSDIQFLEDAGNNVEVDESLFQDIEDLDLDEDDPDFDPLEMGSDED
uniref:RWD domain-containing protein 1 n=1 Tax=Tetraodon nigroviridis TaxID=99883 RepID=H3D288_TETNG